MLGKLIAIVLCGFVGLVIVGLIAGGDEFGAGGQAAQSAASLCRQPAKVDKILAIANDIRLLPGRRGAVTEVDERVWAELPRDSKISVTLALYCSVASTSGNGSIRLQGWRDGETKASMTNGNYMD